LFFKTDELETNSKMKYITDIYRGISEFKKGSQPKTNIVKDEEGDIIADSHSILARQRNHFSQLFNGDFRQTEMHTAEPLMPEPSAFEFEMALEKLKSH